MTIHDPKSVYIWTGDYGAYVVPRRLESAAMSIAGFPDRSFHPLRAQFLAWVKEQDEYEQLAQAAERAALAKNGIGR